jgi:hypothetical protein
MQNREANWEEKRCGIGRCNYAILSGELGGATNGAGMGGELGGATMQIGRSNGAELEDATVQNWEEQGWNIGRRIERWNGTNWEGEWSRLWM